MTLLFDTLNAVKDRNLTKTQLEDFHSTLCELRSGIKLELADVLKAKSLFLVEKPKEIGETRHKITWQASSLGQREIELKNYVGSVNSAIEGVKTRIYALL